MEKKVVVHYYRFEKEEEEKKETNQQWWLSLSLKKKEFRISSVVAVFISLLAPNSILYVLS